MIGFFSGGTAIYYQNQVRFIKIRGDRAMTTREFTVRNSAGIHCRPSGVILTAIKNEFPGLTFEIETSDGTVTPLDSMLTILSLGLGKGAKATLRASGPGEEAAADKIASLFETEFDFPPRS